MNLEPYSQVTLTPIGVVRSPFGERREAPRQPVLAKEAQGVIELFADRNLEQALSDIDSWSHLWVLFWFHLNTGWRPMVRPPRGDRRRGVFATRSPHRPNPIGLSVVKLERRVGLELQVSSLDILDGTPVLDIKPYVPYSDAVPTATGGWPDVGPTREHSVAFDARAERQLAFLGAVGTDLKHTLLSALVLGPRQPRYRRIRKTSTGFVIAIKEWRAVFEVHEAQVTVREIRSGYLAKVLSTDTDPSLDLHRALMLFSTDSTIP